MSKIILDDDSTNLNPLRINENFRKIEEEFNEKVLYRKNPEGEPNEMENHLDMNGYRIFNLPKPTESHEPLRLLDIDLIPEDLQEYVEESKEWAEKSKDYYENTLEALSEGEVYIGDYGPDLTINNYTEFFGKNGIWYRPSPELELPYTTTGDWDSEATLFVSVGDQELRQELISQGIKNGASIVGYRNTTISEYLDNSFLSIKYAKGLGPDEDATKVLQDAVNKWDGNASLTVKIVGELRVDGVVIIPNKETLNPERRITISGGTLIKKNPGWIFTRPTDQELPDSTPLQTGHLTFDGVRFLGPRDESGTYIIDGDNIIRTKFVNCFGDGIQIAYAENYLQSVYIDISSVFRKWSGWLLDCGHLYDVRFYGTAEAGESFLRTRLKTADPAANSMTIRGCIEGLSGKVFEVGPCFGVVIDGNYQEQNAGGTTTSVSEMGITKA